MNPSQDEKEDELGRDQDGITSHVFEPFTLAVGCRVRLLSLRYPNGDKHTNDQALHVFSLDCILKLYDRRYASNIRVDYDNGQPWSQRKESSYQRYLLDPDKPRLDSDSVSFLSQDESEDEGIFEAYMSHQCERMWEKEVEAYRKINGLQDERTSRCIDPEDAQYR